LLMKLVTYMILGVKNILDKYIIILFIEYIGK
jgi:hypothetical protein